ncbi:MAG: FAD binding domain-containing protein [Anaerolineae bacterium]
MEYCRAKSVDEALALHNEPNVCSRLLAGGTDFMIQLRRGEFTCDRIVDVGQIPELRRIEWRDDELFIGANVTFGMLLAHPLIREHAPLLVQMAAEAGAVQLRNMGTIGGNIANAALAADSLPALIALDALAEVVGLQGKRETPLDKLITGPGRHTLQPGEIITGFHFRPPEGRSVFLKVGRRNALNIARLSMSAVGRLDDAGRIAEVRLVPGAALRHTRRVTEVEERLLGRRPESALFEAAGRQMAALMIEISGRRWSTDYKEPVIVTLTRRALAYVFAADAEAADAQRLVLMEHLHRPPEETVAAQPPEPAQQVHTRIVHEGPPQCLSFTLNGEEVSAEVPVGLSLLTVLRDTFGALSAKEGCNSGECGACTVLLDDEAVLSCLTLAHQADGRRVVTVEGMRGPDGGLTDLQQAFIDHGAVQCGICIPGMLLSAEALLARNLRPTREEIRYAIAGNLCRCTGYRQIVDAIEATAAQRRTEKEA